MLVFTWVTICITLTAAQNRHAIPKAQNLDKKILNIKSDVTRGKLELTFPTLYPKFMLRWTNSTLRVQKTVTHKIEIFRQERQKRLDTIKKNEQKKSTTVSKGSKRNAVKGVTTMRSQLPKRITVSKLMPRKYFNEQHQNIRHGVLSKGTKSKSTLKHTRTQKRMQRYRKQQTSRATFRLQTEHKKRSKNQSAVEKLVLNRLKQLEIDLRRMKTRIKNDTEVLKHLKAKVKTEKEITNSVLVVQKIRKATTRVKSSSVVRDSSSKVRQLMGNKRAFTMNKYRTERETDNINKGKFREDLTEELEFKNRAIHFSTRDPLEYDSLDSLLDHYSNLKEYEELKTKGAIKDETNTVGGRRMLNNNPVSIRLGKEVKLNVPPSYKTRRNSANQHGPEIRENKVIKVKKKNIKDGKLSFDDILEQIKTVPPQELWDRQVVTPDKLEVLGKTMLDRLKLPDMLDDTLTNNELYNFDHVKHVNDVMAKDTHSLDEKRKMLLKGIDNRISALYRKYTMAFKKVTQDNLDPVIKNIGVTLHK